MNSKINIAVIGAGFAGLSAASILAQKGFEVTVFEKNAHPGGRCNYFKKEGFHFDMGPSWYWMPDVFEKFLDRFNVKPQDFFELQRLDPSYQVIFKDEVWEIPANYEKLRDLFERHEKGSARKLDEFIEDSKGKYDLSMQDLVYKPALSWAEYLEPKTLKGALQFSLFSPFTKYVKKYFKNPKIQQIMEFPVLFLGAKPQKTPSLYSIMNYADIVLGTWYPMGGMFEISKAFEKVAKQQGVHLHYQHNVEKIMVEKNRAKGLIVDGKIFEYDVVISAADYEFTDAKLLHPQKANYSQKYWEKQQMSPSCLLFYWGVDKEIPHLKHHNLFFDEDFKPHAEAIYDTHTAPKNPLFYVCAPSKTDKSVAPKGKENLFVLIPISAGLELSKMQIAYYKKQVIQRIEKLTGVSIEKDIIVEEQFHTPNFISLYNSYKGNAYGLANTLKQTAVFRPSIRNKKLANLFYCGQLSVPGPGMPPAVISGSIVADYITNHQSLRENNESTF